MNDEEGRFARLPRAGGKRPSFSCPAEVKNLEIVYTEERRFTAEELRELFESVGWLSGKYPERLKKALDGCATVITAWEGERLVGLVNAIDDGELTAYAHYLCVAPDCQGKGVGKTLLSLLKKKYENYLYLILHAEHDGLMPCLLSRERQSFCRLKRRTTSPTASRRGTTRPFSCGCTNHPNRRKKSQRGRRRACPAMRGLPLQVRRRR